MQIKILLFLILFNIASSNTMCNHLVLMNTSILLTLESLPEPNRFMLDKKIPFVCQCLKIPLTSWAKYDLLY